MRGLRAEVTDRGVEAGQFRYILTKVTIPPGLQVGSVEFDPERGTLKWSQDASLLTEEPQ